MELFKLFGTIAINNQEANNNIDETTGKASGAQSKIVESFKKIGTAVVTYFAVDKIKDFGLACIDAASDAQAMESQFTQVFGDVEDAASKSLANIASAAGITENRMKGSFTKIAAFAKTSGMDTADALALSERAMKAVADSAAFYDRSLEETTESLQSFLKGNFENDAALGLSATETTRNAAANELYGKSFKDLSESQKQLTLLKMVEDANALSGALGQSARESETWTNQIGNLKQAWTDFKALVGGYFLENAVDVVMKATGAVQWLSDAVIYLHDCLVDTVFVGVEQVGESLASMASAISPLIQHIQDLIFSFLGVEEPADIMRTIVYSIESVLTSLADRLNSVGTWITNHTPQIIAVITGLWESVLFLWETFGQPVFDTLLAVVGMVYESFQSLMPQITSFVQQCFTDVQKFWTENLKPCLEAIGNFISTVLAPVFRAVFSETIWPAVKMAFDFIKNAWETVLKPVFTGITDFLTGIFTLNFEQAFEGLVSIVKGVANGIINGIEFMVNGAINAVNGLIAGLNKLVGIAGSLLGLNFNIPTIGLLKLPRLEKGGILDKGQVGLLEGRGAEAVVPLDQNSAWISAVARDMEAAGIGGNSQQAQRIIDLLEMLIEILPDTMKEAFASMKFDINNREFARMVKAV